MEKSMRFSDDFGLLQNEIHLVCHSHEHQTFIRYHQNAFQYFRGCPEEILYDYMKQVVVKRLLKQEDSTLSRQFEDFAGFYSFKAHPVPAYRGQNKGDVERIVQFVWDNSIFIINMSGCRSRR